VLRGGGSVWIWSAATGMLGPNMNHSIQASGWVLQLPYALNDKGDRSPAWGHITARPERSF